MKKTILALVVLSFSTVSDLRSAEWAPYLNVEVYGGQSFFSGRDVDGFNGNFVFVPGMRLGDRWTLLPTLAAGYRQSRDVMELAGGGFLTQEQQTHAASVKGIYRVNDAWRAKSYLSFSQEWVKETDDETWGKGLFDYEKQTLGFEMERSGDRWKSLRFGLDVYRIQFPHFQSLAEKQFGAEINTGTDVLDFSARDVAWGGDLAVGARSLLSVNAVASLRRFGDQHVVKADGTFGSDTRRDTFIYTSLGYRRPMAGGTLWGMPVEGLTGVDVVLNGIDSDQNNYDAQRLRFNGNYYDYVEWGVGPRLNFRFSKLVDFGVNYRVDRRLYRNRPVQAADGTYGNDQVKTTLHTIRWTLGYPLMESLKLVAQGAFQEARSNMKYEATYQYDYFSSHYFLGFTYQL